MRSLKATCIGVVVTALSQFCLAYFSLSIQSIYPVWSSPFWPASGAALGACILRGPWMLIGVYIGLALPNLTLWSTTPSWLSLVLPLGNVLETATAFSLLHKAIPNFDYKFTKVKDVGSFLFLAPWIPAGLSASFVQTCLLIAKIIPEDRYIGEMLVFFLGNATGIMLVTPLLLVWRDIAHYQWAEPKGRRILLLLFSIGGALWLFHASSLPTYMRMTSVLVIPLGLWGIWSTGFRGATLLCLLSSFTYFAFNFPDSRPLSHLLNQRHLQSNITYIASFSSESPLNRKLPPPRMLEEALEQIGILTALCLTILPLGVAADELRRRGEHDDLVMQVLDSTFWTWTRKDGVHFFNNKIANNIRTPPLLFEAHLPDGKLVVPSKDPLHPGYLSHWTTTEKDHLGEPLVVNGILQSQTELTKRQAAEARAEMANLEIQALRTHLNPHLIFNCLTGLRAMIKSNPDLARDFTGRLARFLRAVVDSQASTMITLKHEIEICEDYIRLESVRGRDIYLIHQPKDLESSFFIPPLSIVTLIENAVKHGSTDASGKMNIELETEKDEDGSIRITVRHQGNIRNNGKGDQPGGLSFLRQQIRLMFRAGSQLALVQNPNNIVEARVHLPANTLS